MEFISFANLINLVIIILILALYRYFDKNNRSLEKVKRFTDKVKENLSGFVDEKTEEIRNLSIDMKVNLTTAKEVLNRIGSIEVELKSKAESIETLHKQVNKYDTLIRELNTATIVVEENLKRIHDESTFIDKVGKRIKTAQGKIDLIEKSIPSIREEMKKQNNEDLKKISDKLTLDVTQKTKSIHDIMQGAEKKVKDFSVYITRLEGRKAAMEQESIKKFDVECGKFETRMLQKKAEVAKSFKDELSGYLQEAQAQRLVHKKNMDELVQESQIEIADLEDRMLKHLIEFKKDIEQAELDFKTNISKVVESGKNLEHDIFNELREKIKIDAEKVHGEVGKKLIGFSKEVDVRNNELITILGKTKQNTEVWKTGIEKQIEKIILELNTNFTDNKAELEATIAEFVHQNKDSQQAYGAQLGEFITMSENKMQILESEYAKKISDMNQGFSHFKDDYTRQLKDMDSELDKEKEEMLLNFNETMKTVEKQCALRFEQVKKEFDQIDGVGEDIKFRMKNIKKDLQECSCDLLGKIDEFKHTFSDDLSNASTELETVVIKKVDKRISDYEKDAFYRFDKLEHVQSDIESLEQGLRDLMEIKKEELKSDFSEFITHLDEKKKEEREYTNKILSEIRIEIQNLEEEVHELKSKAYQSVSEKLKIFEDEFFTDLKLRNQDMEKSINEWRLSVKEKLQLIAAEHEQDRLGIEEKYNTEIQSEMTVLEEKTKELFTQFKKQWQETLSGEFKTYKLEFNQNSVEYKKEVNDIILDLKNNFASQRDTIVKEVNKESKIIDDEIASLNLKLDTYKTEFDQNTEDLKEEVKDIILDFKNDFATQRDTIFKKANEENKIIDDEIASMNIKLDTYKKEFKLNTKDLKEEVKDIILDIKSDFISQRDTIIKEANEENKIIDDEIVSLNLKLDTYKAEFKQNTEDLKEEVKDIILDIQNNFSTQRDTIVKEANKESKVVDDEIASLNLKLDTYKTEFKKNTEDLKEEVKDLILDFKNDFATQRNIIIKEANEESKIIGDGIASLNMKLDTYKTEFKQNAEDLKEEAKGIILDIQNNFSTQRDTIIKKANEENKIIDDVIASLNMKLDTYKTEFNQNTEKYKEEVKDIILDLKNDFVSQRDTIIKEANEESKIIEDQITSLNMKLDTYKTEFNQNAEEYKEEVKDIILELKNDFASSRDELFKETEEKRGVLNEKLESLGQRLEVFDVEFSERAENVLSDFHSEYQQKQGDFTKRLRELQSEFEVKIKDFKKTITQGTTMVSSTQKEQKSELKAMEDQIKNLSKQLNQAAKDALAGCSAEFQKLQNEFQIRTKTFDENIVKKITSFDASLKGSQEKLKLSHEKYAERIDGEYKALLTNLKDIEKQQQNFVSQTKLFERADSLKITLKNEIEDIRKDILLLDPVSKKMKTLESELVKMNKLSEEMYAKTTRYAAEKRRIDNMEKNFKQLLKISDTIDDKLETVTSSYDTLQEIKIRIRELGELGKEVQAQYERLEKKKEVLDTTTIGVDKSFRVLEELEKEIKRIDTTVESLPPKMLTIDQEIKYLVENKPKADNAVEQMQKLNDLMFDIEERTEKLNKARDWLARTETRLESIGKNAQDQLSMLKALIKEDGTNGKKIKGAPKQDKREMIIKLARQGWLSKEISKATNTSLGEVELILELEPKKR